MLGTAPHIATTAIERTCRELDVALPKSYVARLDAGDKFTENLAKFSTPNTAGQLIQAVFDSIGAGEHPADSDLVKRLALMTQLENYELSRQAGERTKETRGDAVCEHADQLIAAWAAATSADGEVLLETARYATFAGVADLGGMTPQQLIDPDDHKRWVRAATSARRLDSAATGFTSLLAATHLGYPPGYLTLALGPTMNLDQLAEVNRSTEPGRKATSWTIAQAGIAPTLCRSLADFAASCGAVGAEQAAIEEAARQASTLTRFN
jgi:hypothetical protein